MERPVVLLAWEPTAPEEALAAQETLEPVARVEWIHELSPSLAVELLPQTVAMIVGRWPESLTHELPRCRRLRLVYCLHETGDDVPAQALRSLGARLEYGRAPDRAAGLHDPALHVQWAREAAQRVASFLRAGLIRT